MSDSEVKEVELEDERSEKRLFIGGLFPEVKPEELACRFAPYGTVKGTEIKIRKDNDGTHLKTFAYIDMETSVKDLKKCMSAYKKARWHGRQLIVEEAKDNFMKRLEKERQEMKESETDKEVQIAPVSGIQNKLMAISDIATVANFNMKGAVPGTRVPGQENWVVGKYSRVLPVVNLKKSGSCKLIKVDPSKLTHNVKNIKDDKYDDSINPGRLTWQLDDVDLEINRKRKGEFPEWKPLKVKRKDLVNGCSRDTDVYTKVMTIVESDRTYRNSDFEVVPVLDKTGKASSNKKSGISLNLHRFDSDSEEENEEPDVTNNVLVDGYMDLSRFNSDSEEDISDAVRSKNNKKLKENTPPMNSNNTQRKFPKTKSLALSKMKMGEAFGFHNGIDEYSSGFTEINSDLNSVKGSSNITGSYKNDDIEDGNVNDDLDNDDEEADSSDSHDERDDESDFETFVKREMKNLELDKSKSHQTSLKEDNTSASVKESLGTQQSRVRKVSETDKIKPKLVEGKKTLLAFRGTQFLSPDKASTPSSGTDKSSLKGHQLTGNVKNSAKDKKIKSDIDYLSSQDLSSKEKTLGPVRWVKSSSPNKFVQSKLLLDEFSSGFDTVDLAKGIDSSEEDEEDDSDFETFVKREAERMKSQSMELARYAFKERTQEAETSENSGKNKFEINIEYSSSSESEDLTQVNENRSVSQNLTISLDNDTKQVVEGLSRDEISDQESDDTNESGSSSHKIGESDYSNGDVNVSDDDEEEEVEEETTSEKMQDSSDDSDEDNEEEEEEEITREKMQDSSDDSDEDDEEEEEEEITREKMQDSSYDNDEDGEHESVDSERVDDSGDGNGSNDESDSNDSDFEALVSQAVNEVQSARNVSVNSLSGSLVGKGISSPKDIGSINNQIRNSERNTGNKMTEKLTDSGTMADVLSRKVFTGKKWLTLGATEDTSESSSSDNDTDIESDSVDDSDDQESESNDDDSEKITDSSGVTEKEDVCRTTEKVAGTNFEKVGVKGSNIVQIGEVQEDTGIQKAGIVHKKYVEEQKNTSLIEKEKAANSPLKEKAANSPLKEKAANSSLKEKAASSPLKDKAASSPLKDKAASSPLKEKAASSPLKEKAASSPLKEKAASSPLKEKAASSPLKDAVGKTKTKGDENEVIFSTAKPVIGPQKFENKSNASAIKDGRKLPKIEDRESVDKKRLLALRQRLKENKAQKTAIKTALSKLDENKKVNNRIVFDSDSEDDQVAMETDKDVPLAISSVKEKDVSVEHKLTKSLFDSDDEDDDDDSDADRFNIREEFEGSEGRKLAKLQSRFGNDERFKLDARFIESGSEEEEGRIDEEDETTRSLRILQTVVGAKAVGGLHKQDKAKKKFKDIGTLKYDPSREEHQQFEVKSMPKEEPKVVKRKRKKKKKKEVIPAEKEPEVVLPEVSEEKFHEISETLRSTFLLKDSEKTSSGSGFSLLAAFGRQEYVEGNDDTTEDSAIPIPNTLRTNQLSLANRFKVRDDEKDGESDMEVDGKEGVQEIRDGRRDKAESSASQATDVKHSSSFFFTQREEKPKDGAMFPSKPNSKTVTEDWLEKRRHLIASYKSKHKNLRRKKGTAHPKRGGKRR